VQLLILIALFGWIPVCLGLFAALPARRAVVVGMIGAWVLLPPVSIPLAGIPDYDKVMAATMGIILGTLIFQPNRLLEFRFRWFDLPVLCFCLCPLISSLSNGLGLYDGLASLLGTMIRWLLPYLIGRLYFGDLEGLRELTVGIVIGGLFCVLPCLYEMRMSPLLLPQVYGIDRYEGTRLGGYRPRIFFSTGLELGMWMTAGSLALLWLWKCGALKRIGAYPVGSLLLPILLATTVMCRATGAMALLVVGLFVLWFCSRFNSKTLFYALVLLAPTYYAVRIPNLWSGDSLVQFVNTFVSGERAGSLAFRFQCENRLAEKALKQPVWGWGGWGRNRVLDKDGRDWTPTDGMWIIYLGYHGCAGLFTWTLIMILPPWLFLKRFPVRLWSTPTVGPLAVIAMLQSLYMVDCLSNGFLNLIYIVASGGLICTLPREARRKALAQESQGSGQLAGLDQSQQGGHEINGVSATMAPLSVLTVASSFSPASSQNELADRYKKLARMMKDQGQPVQAKAAWVHALGLLTNLASKHPDVPEFQRLRWDCTNDFAWFLLDENDPTVASPPMALGLVSQATEADPECATYWNTLGVAYHRTGDATSAITALERSVALTDGGTAFDYVFLGLAYAQLGRQEQAQSWSARADLWIRQHDAHHPQLSRLHEQLCASLAAGPGPSAVT
jgi:Tetratricopeptide repeat